VSVSFAKWGAVSKASTRRSSRGWWIDFAAATRPPQTACANGGKPRTFGLLDGFAGKLRAPGLLQGFAQVTYGHRMATEKVLNASANH
jgi:hypothetical protein